MIVTALAPRFPAVSFASRAEFDEHRRVTSDNLDARYLYEQDLATDAPELVMSGTCAPCLRPTRYTSNTVSGMPLPDGRMVPNWREELACDCEDRMNARFRATLHFCESVTGLLPSTRVLAFGPASPLSRRLGAMSRLAGCTRLTRFEGAPRLDLPDASVHLAVCSDYLNHVPPVGAALAELRRVLVRGGQLVFTVPFHLGMAETVSRHASDAGGLRLEEEDPVHDFGWDLLDRLREAGFSPALAYAYWSEELGYLGPFNMIFAATA